MTNVFETKQLVEFHYFKKNVLLAFQCIVFLGLAFLWSEIRYGLIFKL